MKNIIIFEGIASSGKSSIEKLLSEKLSDMQLILEGETLMSLIENKDALVANKYLLKQLEIIRNSSSQNIIVDRFHFTHAFRTNSDLTEFSNIENELLNIGKAVVVLLTINPDHIRERIEETISYRKDNWNKGAQGSIDEKVAYYTEQQEILITFSLVSKLKTLQIDTTEKNWDEYVEIILKNSI